MSDHNYSCVFIVLVFLAVFAVVGSKTQMKDEEKEALLEEKVKQLNKWAKKSSVIRLNGDKYKEYVKKSPRNYSTIIMLTALKKERQCAVCGQANKEYQALARSWKNSPHHSNALFFTMADYDEASEVFQSLQVRTAPLFFHFPAKGKRERGDTYQLQSMELSAEEIARWVEQRTSIQIKVYRPINYWYVAGVAASLAAVVGVLYVLRNRLNWMLNKNLWAVLILTVIFTMISGHMWNRIRKPPSMSRDSSGAPIYIHPNRGSQLVTETYIIMTLYGAMAAGFIMMNEICSLKRRWGKMLLALAGLGCFGGFFMLLFNIFRKKSYYPDSLSQLVWG